jgi:tetratricopeptide (TPR) repeat protein
VARPGARTGGAPCGAETVPERAGCRTRSGADGLATTLNTAGLLAWHQADYPAAQAFYAARLALRRAVGDTSSIAASLNNLGLLADKHGQHAAAITLLEEALALRHELGG